MHHHVFGDLHLAFESDRHPLLRRHDQATYLNINNEIRYHAFCDDFGPMNLASTYEFCEMLQRQLNASAGKPIVLVTDLEGRKTTNAVFLIGAYMVLCMDIARTEVTSRLRSHIHRILSYRDISPGMQTFHLCVQDCWDALSRAKSLEWVKFGPDGFDVEEYRHFDNPLNADLHVIVPDKIIAMKGPISLDDGKKWLDTPLGARDFSPAHYGAILNDFDVQLVVRLNEPAYSAQEFEAAGIAVADIFFEDCAVPPHSAVVKFLLMVEHVPGAVAVHCKAGLGRTGTLIGLYMMKSFGFTAREAIGWLRIVRPGSVIGRQQQYLCDMEASIARLPNTCITSVYGRGVCGVRQLVAKIHERVEVGERCVALWRQRALQAPSAGE